MKSKMLDCPSYLSCVAIIVLLCYATGTVSGANIGAFKKLFVFGDSYVDNDNRDPNNNTYTPIGRVSQAWQPPYGRTWPGKPAGRFSDGDVLSDFLSKYIGLKPAPYRMYKLNSSTPTGDGINFAVGGAGVFDNLGFTKTRDQIAQLKALLKANIYNSSVFNESVILFAISGNDYTNYLITNEITLLAALDFTSFIATVVNQIILDLKTLYNLGFRNFVVTELEPVECLPAATVYLNYTACLAPAISPTHNMLLTTEITINFSADSTGANVILLNNDAAFSAVLFNTSRQTGIPTPLKPCCVAKTGAFCGDLDSQNNPLYTLCNPSPPVFFWDEFHPTEAGWRQVFNLFVTSIAYTGGQSLPSFLGI